MAGAAVQVKAFTLRQAILQGWRERWPDFQWALNLKKFFPKANSWDVLGLADHLLEQAMIGPAPNSILLSYLKYAINSQMVSYSNLILAITKFEDFSRDYCVIALLELIENICPHLSCYGKAEECMSLCRALLSCLLWLLQCITHCLDRIHMAQAPQTSEPLPTVLPTAPPPLGLLPSCASALEKVLGGARNRAFLHIARLEEQSIWSLVEQTTWKIPEFLNSIGCPDDVKRRLEECTMVIKRIPSLLLLGEEQSTHVEFPTIQALITLEGTTNLTAEGQPLVEHLLIVKRVQHIPMRFMLLEIWKACMVGLIESPEGIEELKWTAFTFLKMPQVLLKLKKFHQGDKDFNDELNLALESLVKLTPLLDKADHRCNCDCFQLILQECGKFGILSESHNQKLVAFRTTDRDQVPQAKSPENSNVQPNPMLILRAEPTVTNILKTMEGDHSKCVEGLLGVLGHMLTGKSLDLLLAAGAAGRKLKSFARKFSKLNEYAKHGSGESTKASQVRALFFDISFLMLCHITQLYGSEVITSDPVIGGEPTFFESWMQLCMPEEGKSLNPDHVLRVEPGKVEVLLSHLNSSIEMKLTQVKWHEVCASLPGVMSEVLNAWELGLLNMEAVQKITDNLKGRLCSLAVCAVAWLVSHIRVLGLEEREKPLQLIQLLVTPVAGEPTMQFYSERVAIMSSIIERMCTEVMQQTGTRIKFQGNSPADGSHCRDLLPGTHPIRELLQSAFASAMSRGLLDTRALLTLEAVMHTGGTHWFTDNLIKELLKETRKDCADRAVELLYGVFSLDLHQLTLSLLGHVLPPLLTTPAKWHCLTAPPGRALARLAVWCAITSYSTHSRSQISAKYRKRPREDVEDYISLFPLDDTQPSKLLRLLSSNDEDNNTLSSPGDRSMSSSLSASQLHNVNVKEPLNRVLANFFLLLSSTLTLKTVGPQTQFVQWFVQECVDCERGSRGSILHFMPFTMISELTKLPGMANPRLILAITDLGLPLGRRVAAKAIAAF